MYDSEQLNKSVGNYRLFIICKWRTEQDNMLRNKADLRDINEYRNVF